MVRSDAASPSSSFDSPRQNKRSSPTMDIETISLVNANANVNANVNVNTSHGHGHGHGHGSSSSFSSPKPLVAMLKSQLLALVQHGESEHRKTFIMVMTALAVLLIGTFRMVSFRMVSFRMVSCVHNYECSIIILAYDMCGMVWYGVV